jgi:hypothetical protein
VKFLSKPTVLVAVAISSLIVALGATAMLTWVLVDPQYWFPGAYAQQGARVRPVLADLAVRRDHPDQWGLMPQTRSMKWHPA